MAKVERRHREQALCALRGEVSKFGIDLRWIEVGGDTVDIEHMGPCGYFAANRIARAIADAEQRGYKRCTADVLAYLERRRKGIVLDTKNARQAASQLQLTHDCIEAGAHIGAAERGEGSDGNG